MKDKNPENVITEFLESLPSSITGTKNEEEYPFKNLEHFVSTFKKNKDGTIDICKIKTAIDWVLRGLYDHGFLTIRPLKSITFEEKITNASGKTNVWVTVETFLDKGRN